jgi:hypothetical protein
MKPPERLAAPGQGAWPRIAQRAIDTASRSPVLWPAIVRGIVAVRCLEHRLLCLRHGRASTPAARLLPPGTAAGRHCHVLANGESVLCTIASIRDGDFVIAMNAGALLPCRIDLYLHEVFPATGVDALANDLPYERNVAGARAMVGHVARHHPRAIRVLKNLARTNPGPDLFDPAGEAVLLREVIFPAVGPQGGGCAWQAVVERMLDEREPYVIQSLSSVVCALLVAHRAGFRSVSVHGLDGGGNHFFHADGFRESLDGEARALLDWIVTYTPKVERDRAYTPGSRSVGIVDLLTQALRARRITVDDLAAASRTAPG